MPFGFVAHRAEFLVAEEVNQIGFRYVIGAVTDEMRHTVFAAPLVYGGFAVAGERYDFIGRHHIGAADKQRCIVAVKPVQSFRRQLSRHTDALVSLCPIPAGGSRIVLRVHPTLMEIVLHILFTDLIAACPFARIPAGDLAALQKISGGGFADMADLIELFFCDKVRNLIPIDPFIHGQNTSGFIFRLEVLTVGVCIAASGDFSHFLSFFSPKVELRFRQVFVS